jgi:signal recognition particle subunit SRP54
VIFVLEKLSHGLRGAIEKLTRSSLVDKEVVEETLRELQRALLGSDVDVKLVFDMSDRLRKRANEELPKGLSRKEYMIKAVYEELTAVMGIEPKVNMGKQRILLLGLFGSGKTSTAAKLARFYQKRGLKPALICCDTFRPAAYEQLEQLSRQINVPFYGEKGEKNPAKIVKNGLEKFSSFDIIIVDSSGRDALDEEMIREIKAISDAFNPDEKFLVLPADIGQAVKQQASAFQEALKITGVIVTKMDATAKGGGALTACSESRAQVKFIAIGEKPEDLETYDPKKFVSRLVGFGDIEGLLEKVKEVSEPELAERLLSNEFSMGDFISQIESMGKVGTMDKILDMMGMSGMASKLPKDMLNVQEAKMKKWKHMASSMTKEEKDNPEIINASRITRIAKGSGASENDVRELLSSYKKVKKMTRMLSPGKLKGMKNAKDMAKLMKGMKF